MPNVTPVPNFALIIGIAILSITRCIKHGLDPLLALNNRNLIHGSHRMSVFSFMLHPFTFFFGEGTVLHFGVWYETLLRGCNILLKCVLIAPADLRVPVALERRRIWSFWRPDQVEGCFIEGNKENDWIILYQMLLVVECCNGWLPRVSKSMPLSSFYSSHFKTWKWKWTKWMPSMGLNDIKYIFKLKEKLKCMCVVWVLVLSRVLSQQS